MLRQEVYFTDQFLFPGNSSRKLHRKSVSSGQISQRSQMCDVLDRGVSGRVGGHPAVRSRFGLYSLITQAQ